MKISREEKLFEVFENLLPRHYGTDKVRFSQVQMAMDISAFLHQSQRDARILFIQAPVGTGKSLGALVPALMEKQFQKFDSNRVVYATATINLQGQLMQSEVPILKEIGLLNEALLAKGKSHYYCHRELQKVEHLQEETQQQLREFYSTSNTGQRNDFELEYGPIDNRIWEKVNYKLTKRDCDNCSYAGACGTRIHRSRFLDERNQLVITNHDQLIESVLRRFHESIQSPIVPIDPGIIIIDEAHHFQENFLSRLQETYSLRELKGLVSHNLFPKKMRKNYTELIRNLHNVLEIEAIKVESLQGRYPLPSLVPDILIKIENLLTKVINEIASKESTFNNSRYSREDELLEKLENYTAGIRDLVNEKEFVSWVTYEDQSFSCIERNFPTEFRRLMNYLSSRNKIIVMSGTLVTNGDFTPLLNQWRLLKSNVHTKIIPESFQYKKQALIYVPEGIESPNRELSEVIQEHNDHIDKMLRLTYGRTLLLSTSKKHMDLLHPFLQVICESLEINLLKQEQGGVEQLTQQFKKDETSVLLGSGSFYSGISVQGTALVSVIFNRLPFPVPDDPFLALIGEGFDEDVFFDEITFPHMMVKLNQGVGRLIRDIGDYGIITILDPRIFTSHYGPKIREDFERRGYTFTRSIQEVNEFYNMKLQKGSEADYYGYNRDLIQVNDLLKDFGSGLQSVETVEEKPKRKARSKLTQSQKEFALRIYSDNNMKFPSKGMTYSDSVFKALVDIYYQSYRDPSIIYEHFPFKNEEQKQELCTYPGSGNRIYKRKKCTIDAFGCSGKCSSEENQRIIDLISSVGGKIEAKDFYPMSGFCWLNIEPLDKNDQIIEMCLTTQQAAANIEQTKG